ncbi:MAG: ribonuclease III [Actinomycetota bacterium]
MAKVFRGRKRMAVADRPYRSFEDALGWSFHDPELLERALTHRSYCAEHAGTLSNERLEFLGDAVLGLLVTDFIFRELEPFAEGDLSKVRASVVNAEALAEVAAEIGLGDALRLGRGEDDAVGRSKPSILGDAMEAVIGAVYLDGGGAAAADVVLRLLEPRIVESAAGPGGHDPKGRLNELLARESSKPPRYQVRREGPPHAPNFFATVLVGGEAAGVGEGRTKRQAEQVAAQSALRRLLAVGKQDEDDNAGVDTPPPEGRDAGAA